MGLKIGTDPEVFCVDENLDVISPAILEMDYGLTPIIDDEKHPIYILNKDDGYSWMMDGVAFELTTHKPLNNSNELYVIINRSLDSLEKLINRINPNFSLYKEPVVKINPKLYLDRLDISKIYQGFIFGCDPDEDAIATGYECETQDVKTHPFRYGGGHLHFSGSNYFKFHVPSVRLLAICVGNFCISESLFPEKEKQRATTYGKPGRFRPQQYKNGSFGIEYRSPSNSWISLSEEKMNELEWWSNKAVKFLEEERGDILNKYLDVTIDSITNANQELARDILERLRRE